MDVLFPPYEPNRSKYHPRSTKTMINALPTADGWGPLPKLAAFSNAMPEAPAGAILVRRQDTDAFVIYSGGQNDLYRLNSATDNFDEISKSADVYSCPVGENWSFEPFGTTLLAANVSDPMQFVNIDSTDDFADVTAHADTDQPVPQARFLKQFGVQLAALNTNLGANVLQLSGFGNYNWWQPRELGADFQEFKGGGPGRDLAHRP